MPNFTLRPLAPDDVAAVAALIRAAFAAQSIATDPPPSALRVTEPDIAAHLQSGGGAVAEVGRTLVGSALWGEQDDGLYLARLAVAPAFRRCGIAKRLIAAAETAARSAGLPGAAAQHPARAPGQSPAVRRLRLLETTRKAHPGYAELTFVNMEKRLSMGARPWVILAAIAIARAGFGYQYQTVASLAPDLMRLFRLDYATLGTLIGAFMLLGAFLALPLGLLARQLGDRLVLGGGIGLMVAGPVISAAAADPVGIGLGRGIAGAGAVAMIVLQNKIIADWFSGRRFMWAISASVAAYPIGVGLAQLVLPPLALGWGWQAAFLSDALPMAVAFALFLASFRPSPHAPRPPRRFSAAQRS